MADRAPGSRSVKWTSGQDLLVLFTDGITDALNEAGQPMGERRVLDTIKRHATESPAEIVDHVFAALREHTGEIPPRDDLTLVVLRS
jgi:sigma-B regulation protein RsbU (phosphoserine phosphatase)